MANKKRTVVTIETRQRTVVRRARRHATAWCESCRAEVLMLTPDEAAALSQTTTRTVFRRVEAGGLHFNEGADGTLLVCANSLTPDGED